MNNIRKQQWTFDRQVNLSTLIQIGMLAGLIIVSWVNLQRQLDLVARDVELLLDRQKEVNKRLEELLMTSISHEVRIGTIENGNTISDRHEPD